VCALTGGSLRIGNHDNGDWKLALQEVTVIGNYQLEMQIGGPIPHPASADTTAYKAIDHNYATCFVSAAASNPTWVVDFLAIYHGHASVLVSSVRIHICSQHASWANWAEHHLIIEVGDSNGPTWRKCHENKEPQAYVEANYIEAACYSDTARHLRIRLGGSEEKNLAFSEVEVFGFVPAHRRLSETPSRDLLDAGSAEILEAAGGPEKSGSGGTTAHMATDRPRGSDPQDDAIAHTAIGRPHGFYSKDKQIEHDSTDESYGLNPQDAHQATHAMLLAASSGAFTKSVSVIAIFSCALFAVHSGWEAP